MTLNKQKGYIALTSMLVIMAVVIVIVTTTSLLSVNEIQSALSGKKSEESLALVEGCVEEALLRLNTDGSLPSTVAIPEGSCSVTINSQSADSWNFTTKGQFNGYSKSISVLASRGSTVTVSSWTEL